jgi:DNA-binding NarL/FixJ family response regulator
MPIRVLIADDQELVRTGFRMILQAQPDMQVAGEAADGIEAIELAARHSPDVVLMDIRMPRLDGLQATQRLAGTGPRVLILTTFDLDEYVFAALRAGASGFLLKNAPATELLTGVRVVAAGDGLLAPSVTGRLIAHFTRWSAATNADPAPPVSLTPREEQVWRLIAQGLPNAQIAARLVLAETTVKSHVASLLTKLGVHDRVQAVVLAYETGFVRPGPAA